MDRSLGQVKEGSSRVAMRCVAGPETAKTVAQPAMRAMSVRRGSGSVLRCRVGKRQSRGGTIGRPPCFGHNDPMRCGDGAGATKNRPDTQSACQTALAAADNTEPAARVSVRRPRSLNR